jgi:hypothetical protein
MFRLCVILALAVSVYAPRTAAQSLDTARKGYDTILDLYVRDGFVYYRALKSDRSRLDAFVGANASAVVDKAPRDEQLAFWINAYNALVLQAVIDRYPIAGKSAEYPSRSIRQIPGVFERTPHRVAGRMLTLDQIEQQVLPTFQDARVYFALGRGAVGSGRLRSEAFTAERLETQLTEAQQECASRSECVQIDRQENVVSVSSIFSWREQEFAAAYADHAPPVYSQRSPIERAILAFVARQLLTTEREFLEKNHFRVAYLRFDWDLNDLTGRGDR